jgi:recombination protein RecT
MAGQEIAILKAELGRMSGEFDAAMPVRINHQGQETTRFNAQQFNRWILTHVHSSAQLMQADRMSIYQSAMRAAQDGLKPDGHEGAMVPFFDKKRSCYIAQWMPMVYGLRKLVMQSGEILNLECHAVYANDQFDFALGDQPYIAHKPAMVDRGELIAVYSIATFKNGTTTRDVMNREEIDKIKAISKGKNTPWNNPTFYPEMAKKTVVRRHCKQLPQSGDLIAAFTRDDAAMGVELAAPAAIVNAGPIGIEHKLAALVPPTGDNEGPVDADPTENETQNEPQKTAEPETDRQPEPTSGNAETEDPAPVNDEGTQNPTQNPKPKAKPETALVPLDEQLETEALAKARQEGGAARGKGMSRKAIPGPYRDIDHRALGDAWIAGWDEGGKKA